MRMLRDRAPAAWALALATLALAPPAEAHEVPAVAAQRRGQALDECGEQGSVGPVQARFGVGSAEYGDFVA